MPNTVTFDGPTRVIREIDTGSDNELDVIDIYSEWKVWTADNTEFLPAFRVTGGEPLTPTQSQGSTFFLQNGWKLQPAEHSHKLTLVGALLNEGGVGTVMLPTDGPFNIQLENLVAANAIAANVSLSGLEGGLSALESLVGDLRKVLINKMITDPSAGTITIFEDDGSTVLYSGELFEDAAGTQRYRGDGAEHRGKMS